MEKMKGSPSSKIPSSKPKFAPKTPARGEHDVDRSKTHETASPSPRCGFGWVRDVVSSRLASWNEEDANDCKIPISDIGENDMSYKCLGVSRAELPHLIGSGGRIIRALEDFCGVFIAIRHLDKNFAEVMFTGPRVACVLAHFCGELIQEGYYSVMTTLLRHGI